MTHLAHIPRRTPAAALALITAVLGGLAAAPPALAAGRSGAPCASYARACVDLGRQEAWLMRGGRVVYGPVPVATGRAGWGTPAGTFRVQRKDRHWWSTAFNAPMPYSVFFYRGDAFHAGSVWVRSHGCIHLSYSAAARFYGYLRVGDAVQIVW